MIAEIVAGWWTGSMALLADGWRMGMHAAAMGVAVLACRFMRRHARSDRYADGGRRAADLSDPLMGLVGAAVIGRWSLDLLRRTAEALLGGTVARAHAHGSGRRHDH